MLEKGQIPTSIPRIEDPAILVSNYVEDTLADLEPIQVSNTQEFEEQLENIYNDLTSGLVPTTIPSIEGIPPERMEEFIVAYDQVVAAFEINPAIPLVIRVQAFTGLKENEEAIKSQIREGDVRGALTVAIKPLTGPVVEEFVDDAYDRAFQKLQESGFPQEALAGLSQRSDEIKEFLGAGDIKGSLKLGARGLAGPLIDEALDELRHELDDQARLDLVAKAAEQENQSLYEIDPERAREEFLDNLDIARNAIEGANLGKLGSLLIIITAPIFMGLVHLPRLASSLRWPGLTLLLTGVAILALGIVLNVVLPGLVGDLVKVSSGSLIPPTLVTIISDVLETMGKDVVNTFILPSIILVISKLQYHS